ncbi:hypothetical protein FPCIR_13666 [Fusarium pseudocircinatum]|uniref:Uncharacterized protein n=1 Tax=Fusarium pseudocircinatum TaxID=56676 RepID=A0A8H5KHD1_9HYPO|nr:hypothetical protein FPCIR_13666 [Fusarium pseudocircinatum]
MSEPQEPVPVLSPKERFTCLKTGNIDAVIDSESQLLVSLKRRGEDFDFLPSRSYHQRRNDGQYHWGDVTYRYRHGSDGWIDGDSAQKRSAVEPLQMDSSLAAADLGATVPEGPLNIIREWLEVNGDLALRFTIRNTSQQDVEIGSLGLPIEFNCIFTGKTQSEMQDQCCLFDPYIGFDAGHLRVAPVNPKTGSPSGLLVTPLQGTDSPFEAFRNLEEPRLEDTAYGTHTFENLYEWQILTRAWAENEWAQSKAMPWHEPSSRILSGLDSFQIGVRFTITEGLRGFDEALRRIGTPSVVAVPGYILPQDLPGQLLVSSLSPVKSFSSFPEGALIIRKSLENVYAVHPSGSNSIWGRARLEIRYQDGKLQTVHYFITKPTNETLDDMGNFLYTKAWFTDETDVFNRAPSIMSYDYEEGNIILQDSRVWVSGLSDEGGTGAYVAAAMKQLLQPNHEEMVKLDEFVNKTIWGKIQLPDHSVKKSLFFHDPNIGYHYDQNVDWSQWVSWSREDANLVDRAYNYVHPTAVYWVMYRLARAYPKLLSQTWDWYLDHAWATAYRMTESDVQWTKMGLMGETVFGYIIVDPRREGLVENAILLEGRMKVRTENWNSEAVPFGSEAPWDSTGQEGVYYWAKWVDPPKIVPCVNTNMDFRFFGFDDLAARTVDSVLGYMPTVPHWAWNGNARRYWDFDVAGKLRRIERQIHNYGSSLNSQVLLDAFRHDPTDLYLLRVGYGGSLAPIANINQEGFPSTGFHAWPDTMKWDGSTGDYGGAFLGMALNGGTYITEVPEIGPVAFGGTLTRSLGRTTVVLKSAVRQRVYIGSLRLMIEIDMGQITYLHYSDDAVSIFVEGSYSAPDLDSVVVWLTSTSSAKWHVTNEDSLERRGGWKCAADGSEISIVRV